LGHKTTEQVGRDITILLGIKKLTVLIQLPAKVFSILARLYQLLISPFTPGSCRFDPTCSQYAIEAINRFGLIKGSVVSLKRIARCQPFGKWGFDPVPSSIKTRRTDKAFNLLKTNNCVETPKSSHIAGHETTADDKKYF